MGAIPGIGVAVIDWIAYGHALRTEKGAAQTFGRGGLKAYSMPLIDALAISNDASGQTVVDRGPDRGPRAMAWADQLTSSEGRVQAVLHGKRGEVNGAILEDGTILRLPPPEAQRFAAFLTPGQSINAQGNGLVTPLGRVIDVQTIGQAGISTSPPTFQ